VRSQPYQVIIKSIDNSQPVQLAYYHNIFVYVHAPPVQNLQATSQCNDITLTWSAAICNPQNNPLTGYKIYRKADCNAWTPAVCQTGVPVSSGYTYIGTSTTLSYTDVNLSYGVSYSYIVIAVYADGAQSYASTAVCVSLKKEVPIITHVDITNTSQNTGSLDLRWFNPLAGASGLDTNAYPPPYRYDIFRKNAYTNPSQYIGSINTNAFYQLTQNLFQDNNLNTADSAYCYRIDFYSGSNLICSSTPASSVYLNCTPSDNTITLSWQFNVPWNNSLYEVYRFNGTSFVLIGTTTTTTYVDSSLANGVQKCYKVKAIGAYSDITLPSPLENWSEEKCCTPQDIQPPCAPSLSLLSDCETSANQLSWNNPNLTCANDVVAYNIYHTPILNGDFTLIATIPSALITTYVHDSLSSIAGCYYVTAIDSFNNESAVGTTACADNCPVYELPNVFTPNGDGTNDYFIPFPYKYVKDVDLKIFNRWGDLVFSTTNPDVNWDGTHQLSKQPCSDGVYYYVCVVNEIHLEGVEARIITGFVHIIKQK
jgi:gliding motility-associated-like protein